MRITKELWLLSLIPVLWLLGVAFLWRPPVAVIVLTILGLLALALCAQHAFNGRHDSVAPWACCSLVPLAFLGILALPNVHLHEFTGVGSGCDYMAQTCAPQPLQGFVHALPLISFLAAGAATLLLIANSARRANDQGLARSA